MAMSKFADVKTIVKTVDPKALDEMDDVTFAQMANPKIRSRNGKHHAHDGAGHAYWDHELDFSGRREDRKGMDKVRRPHGPASKKSGPEWFA